MIHLKIDHINITVEEGTTVLEAAHQAGISIPSMCYLKGYGNHPSCMVCLVRDRNTNALVPSCSLKVSTGMDIDAGSDEVRLARKQALEMLMSDHVGDCEAPCSLTCPAGMNIPLMNRLIVEGRFSEALKVVKKDIALPHILGYICPAPCENACRRKQIDEPVSICLLKRFSAAEGEEKGLAKSSKTEKDTQKSAKKVAIIGSGPAGLSAAYYLQLYGHDCSIFEKSAEAGGTIRYSVPEEELPREVLNNEVDYIRSLGVSFQFNTLITGEIYKQKIKKEFDAIIIATGDISTQNELQGLFKFSKTGFELNQSNMGTSQPGVFVCGSAIRPHKMAVRSTAQGKTAAMAAHHYLQNINWEKPAKIFNSRFSKLLVNEFAEYLKESSSVDRVKALTNPATGFSTDEAIREALRCMHCDCRKKDDCKLREYADEYKIDSKRYSIGERRSMTKQTQHEIVVYEPEKCIKCGLCIEITHQKEEKFGLAFEGRGFDVIVNSPLGTSLNESLTHSAIMCADFCPTGAISLKDKYAGIYRKKQKK